MVITVELSKESIKSAKKQLRAYKRDLSKKCALFVRRLADLGIQTAKGNVSSLYAPYLIFRKEVNPAECECRGLMIATQTGLIRRQWRSLNTANGIETADVSPLLMAEFGSGAMASDHAEKYGMGQGTFPGQKHAFDDDGWSWMDLGGEWHHSFGEVPTMPVQRAFDEMCASVYTVAKEVFG
jgi:hypothetical protein